MCWCVCRPDVGGSATHQPCPGVSRRTCRDRSRLSGHRRRIRQVLHTTATSQQSQHALRSVISSHRSFLFHGRLRPGSYRLRARRGGGVGRDVLNYLHADDFKLCIGLCTVVTLTLAKSQECEERQDHNKSHRGRKILHLKYWTEIRQILNLSH